MVLRRDRDAVLRHKLTATEAICGDDDVYETLRIEAGSPEYGKDIDDTRFVMEVARAERAVSFAKGCFPGQEPIVMSRDRAGFVNRAFLGMKVLEGGPIPRGTKLMRDGVEVGVVTSSIYSPRLESPIAIGYVKRGHQERGTLLSAGQQILSITGHYSVSAATGESINRLTLIR